jgi:hypothetical protein
MGRSPGLEPATCSPSILKIAGLPKRYVSFALDIGLDTTLTGPFELIPGNGETNSRFPACGPVSAVLLV